MGSKPLSIGQTACRTVTVTGDAIKAFCGACGDENPIHLDPSYAATTAFGRPIAPGLLTASYMAAIFANDLPGPGSIYMDQSLRFLAPVYEGDDVFATVTVVAIDETRGVVTFRTECSVAGRPVLIGEARIRSTLWRS